MILRFIKFQSVFQVFLTIFLLCQVFICPLGALSDEDRILEVQLVYSQYTQALMTGDFKNAYSMLSGFTRKRVPYDLFLQANQLIQKRFNLKASQLSELKIRGKYAAAKTITYIDFLPEKEQDEVLNGKIETVVYFIREKELWKIATGDDDNRKQFLEEHPGAKGLASVIPTRVYYKKGGYWITFEYKTNEKDNLVIPL